MQKELFDRESEGGLRHAFSLGGVASVVLERARGVDAGLWRMAGLIT